MRPLVLLFLLFALAPVECSERGAGRGDPPGRASPPADHADRGPARALPGHGVSSWENAGIPPADVAAIGRSGAAHYRFNMITSFVDWNGVRRTTRRYDRLVREAALRDVTLLPVLMSLRTIRRPEAPGTPAEHARWRELVGFYASRYGPRGAFWRDNSDLPYRPIRAWEVWNEPNLRQFWGRRPRAREYVRLLEETRAVLRGVDAEARIVSAGLAWRRGGPRYLRAMLRHGSPCLFDAAGVHPYADSVAESVAYVEAARAVLDRLGARDAPLWITEVGWRVGSRGRYTVPTARAQARALREFAATVDRRREELRVGPVFAFALRDRVRGPARPPGHDYGMLHGHGVPSPAWGAWSAVAGETGPLQPPPPRDCGEVER